MEFAEAAVGLLVQTGQRAARFESKGYLAAGAITAAAVLAAADGSRLTLTAARRAIRRAFTPAARLSPAAVTRALEELEESVDEGFENVEPYSRVMSALKEADRAMVAEYVAEFAGLVSGAERGPRNVDVAAEPLNTAPDFDGLVDGTAADANDDASDDE